MSTAAQTIANTTNAQASTGPRTDEGKSVSSQNAVSHGLFANVDFIRPGEEEAHAQLTAALESELTPSGTLESSLVDEIRRALWRLNRCGQVEAGFLAALSNSPGPIPDPLENDATAKLQTSVDRSRAQAHRLLHKCTLELRRLQTERHYRGEIFVPGSDLAWLGVADYRAVTKGVSENKQAESRQRNAEYLDLSREMHDLSLAPPPETPITERTQSPVPTASKDATEIARNAPCPCNSGQKYKRCCGKTAAALRRAA